MRRAGISREQIDAVRRAYQIIYRQGTRARSTGRVERQMGTWRGRGTGRLHSPIETRITRTPRHDQGNDREIAAVRVKLRFGARPE